MSTQRPDFSKMPVQPPPLGVTSNFVDPPTRAGEVIAISVVLIVLSTAFVFLRLYARLVLVRIFEVGDYLLLVGYVIAVANSAVTMSQTTVGLGRHAWDIPMTTMYPRSKMHGWWGMKLYPVSLGFTKTSILCLYPRISPTRTFRICVWVLMGAVACWTLTTLIWSIAYCIPISDFWRLEAALAGKCRIKTTFIAFTGICNVLTDLVLLILPIRMLWHVALPAKTKIGVTIVLATGSLVSVISVIRLATSMRKFNPKDDMAYRSMSLLLWSSAELHVAVVCACMTTLRPFIRHFFPSLMGSSAERATKSLSSRHRSAQRVMEFDKGYHIKLRELNIKSTPRCEHSMAGGKAQTSRDNTSEDHIFCDENPTLADSHKTFSREQDMAENGEVLEETECKLK